MMRALSVLDGHPEGEPMRIVVAGLERWPAPPGGRAVMWVTGRSGWLFSC